MPRRARGFFGGEIMGLPAGLVIGGGAVAIWWWWSRQKQASEKAAAVTRSISRGLPGEQPEFFYIGWYENLDEGGKKLVDAYIAAFEAKHGMKPVMSDVYNVVQGAWDKNEEVPWPEPEPEGPGAWEWERAPGGGGSY
jgi:hypothetical protein